MRPRRFLLVTKALTAAGLVAACGKETGAVQPLPGNPKGVTYDEPKPTPPDAGSNIAPLPANPKGSNYDNAPPPSAGPPVLPPPGNPKGSHYDAGVTPTPKKK